MAVRLGIDTGGTFTDLIGIDDVTGELVVAKSPSMPSRPVDAIMNVIPQRGIMTEALEAIGVGMNVATNALLQWKRPQSSTSPPQAENDAEWYEERMLHCATCGRMIAKRYLAETSELGTKTYCSQECLELYHDYVLVERGSEYRPHAEQDSEMTSGQEH